LPLTIFLAFYTHRPGRATCPRLRSMARTDPSFKQPRGASPRRAHARRGLTPPGALFFHTASRHASWPYQRRRLSLRSFFGKNLPIYMQEDRTLALAVSQSCRFVSVSGSTVS
jgi:hypothetical protein